MRQKFAGYDSQGTIVAFYDSVDSPLPSGVDAIEITLEEWQACLADPGWTVANGALVAPLPPSAAELAAQAEALARDARDSAIMATDWLVARHRDEVDTQAPPSLSVDQFGELMTYRQRLRDWPEHPEFPAAESKPDAPAWLPELLS
ncbi:phage tail assembly chaperone [Achromobacter denitrificans]|uniref:phage tail assembly chaperone n=1 Tax=Achromobacter denitrificans TaxID=32002 RepID=UPI00163AFD99|nr:phage tail assembly chaperone [Achromobacter denitrificans]